MVPMLRWTERENQGGAKKNIKKQKGCGPEVENVLKKNVLLVLQANRADFDESETRLHEQNERATKYQPKSVCGFRLGFPIFRRSA